MNWLKSLQFGKKLKVLKKIAYKDWLQRLSNGSLLTLIKSRSKALASRAKYQEVPFGATEKIWTYDINCNCKDWKIENLEKNHIDWID